MVKVQKKATTQKLVITEYTVYDLIKSGQINSAEFESWLDRFEANARIEAYNYGYDSGRDSGYQEGMDN